ncbi:hypothetical protein AAFF_G00094250 [Aldrovandia affinis]|uniref:Uncharacterized protein n=1 Tax=Aldrovandia affinis TaxID=143900 RepID=A0AAD7WZ14_9TELE|nr:hypothetical protein AAFF_G00094250 [Aldrovandia affinis]
MPRLLGLKYRSNISGFIFNLCIFSHIFFRKWRYVKTNECKLLRKILVLYCTASTRKKILLTNKWRFQVLVRTSNPNKAFKVISRPHYPFLSTLTVGICVFVHSLHIISIYFCKYIV